MEPEVRREGRWRGNDSPPWLHRGYAEEKKNLGTRVKLFCLDKDILWFAVCVRFCVSTNHVWPVTFAYLFLLQWPGSLLLCKHHLSLSRNLNTLSEGLLQLLDSLSLLTKNVLWRLKGLFFLFFVFLGHAHSSMIHTCILPWPAGNSPIDCLPFF